MRLIVDHVRRRYGPEAVEAVLVTAGETRPVSVLEDESVWSSYDQKVALFAAAAEVTGNPDVGRAVGQDALESSFGTSVKIALGLVGSPAMLVRGIARACGKFSTAAEMQALDVSPVGATVSYRVKDGYAPSPLDCGYTEGLLTRVPVLFGLPPARIDHVACQSKGAPECLFRLRWQPRLRLLRRSRSSRVAGEAVLTRLHELQATLDDLISTTELDRVLDIIARRAGSAVGAQRFVLSVRLPDPVGDCHRTDGLDADESERFAAGLLTGEPLSLEGHDVIVADVRTSARSYGKLAAFSRAGFFQHDAELLRSYAGLAATGLEAVTAIRQAEERRTTAEALVALAGHLQGATTREAVAKALSEAARTVVSADAATVLLFGEDMEALTSAGQAGLADDLVALLPLVKIRPEDTEELRELLAHPEAPRMYDSACDDRYIRSLLTAFRTSLVAVVSIAGTSHLHGVLIAAWDEGSCPPAASDDLFGRLNALAQQATNALDKHELLEQVHRQATTDSLTEIANRREFTLRLGDIAGPATPARPAALLFVDLDGFKAVNDTLGHAAGDEVLRTVARRLRSCVRRDDLVARLGGDEFTVVLRDVGGRPAAEARTAEIMKSLAEPILIDGQSVRIGCSIGVVLVDAGTESASSLLRDADAAMYASKKAGGNRMTVWNTAGLEELVTAPERD